MVGVAVPVDAAGREVVSILWDSCSAHRRTALVVVEALTE